MMCHFVIYLDAERVCVCVFAACEIDWVLATNARGKFYYNAFKNKLITDYYL